MAINPQAREYVLGQMAQTPELRGALTQFASRSPLASRTAQEMTRLNPNNYNRYNPNAGKMTHNLHSAGWGGWANDPAKQQMIAESELFKDVSGSGIIGGTKHFDERGNRMEATAQLRDLGITDMDQIGVAAGPDGNVVFYSKLTGQELPNQLRGHKDRGQTVYFLNLDENGNVTLDDHFQKDKRRSGLGKVAPGFTNPIVSTALAIGAGYLAGPLASSLGGGLSGSAASGALLGAGHAAITGGDIAKSALLGGVGGGLNNYVGGTNLVKGISNPVMRGATAGALTGAGTGALGAGLYGGNVVKGGLSGALAGGAGGAGQAYFGGDPNTLAGQASGAVGRRLGSTFGNQISDRLIGSPFEQRFQPQQAQQPSPEQIRQRQMQELQQRLSTLPAHARDRVQGMMYASQGF